MKKKPSEFELLQPLFPDCVATCCGRIELFDEDLLPEEEPCVARAVEKRRREFAAGRTCARRALRGLGHDRCPLPRGEHGVTLWPPGIAGSISHSDTWCGAAAALKDEIAGIGLDIETVRRVTLSISKRVLTAEEAGMLRHLSEEDARRRLALVFSAKEAIYKCLFQIIGERIGFHDALVVPQNDNFSLKIKMVERIASRIPHLQGSYFEHDGNVFTAIVMSG